MAEKYLKPYGIWVTVEGEDEPIQETENEISQAEVSAAKLLIDQQEKNEEALDSNDRVPETLVNESNAVYKSALTLLKRNIKQYDNLTMAQESYWETRHNLILSNNRIISLLDSLVDEKKLFKTKSGYTFSKEYSKFSWSDFLLGPLKALWSALTDKTTTEIEKPGLLVRVMVTDVMSWLDQASKQFARFPMIYADLFKGKGHAGMDYNHIFGLFHKKNFYRTLFTSHKSNKNDDLNLLKAEFEIFKKTIELIKEDVCKSCEERQLSGSERSELAKFDPIEANKEMTGAIEYYKRNASDLVELAESAAEYVNSEILDYIKHNIHNK